MADLSKRQPRREPTVKSIALVAITALTLVFIYVAVTDLPGVIHG